MNKIDITAFKYGETKLSEAMIIKNGDKNKFYDIALLFFLIQTENRKVLIDVGCDDMPGFVVKNFIKPYELLKKFGLSNEDITDVIITHAHHDHIQAVKYYKNSIIHIQKDEYDIAKNNYLSEGFKVNIFDSAANVADSLEIVKVGSHSIGSCIVKLNSDNNKLLFVGDECYDSVCFDKMIPSGSVISEEKNIKFIEEYKNSQYSKIFFHQNSFLKGKNGWKEISITT